MHTARTIGLIVLGVALGVVAAVAAAVGALGPGPGLAWSALVAAGVVVAYVAVVRPWHRRWGATAEEAHAELPGDDLGIAARAERRHAVDEGVVQAFLAGERIAVVGASDDKGNMGGALVKAFGEHGYDVVAVHPRATTVAGVPCYPTVAAVPGPLDGVVVVVGAEHAVAVVRDCIAAGVGAVWLFKGLGGEGALSDEAVELARDHGVTVVPGACPLMFLPPVRGVHRLHQAARHARGTLVTLPG